MNGLLGFRFVFAHHNGIRLPLTMVNPHHFESLLREINDDYTRKARGIPVLCTEYNSAIYVWPRPERGITISWHTEIVPYKIRN